MVSILVPVFNRPIIALARELSAAAVRAGVPYEIIFIEDGSTEYLIQNKSVAEEKNSVYRVNSENVGRSAIRNLLADAAKYGLLLFLDCDVLLPDDLFLKRYLEAIEGKDVVCGGHTYRKQAPTSRKLHHLYGLKRECIPVTSRREKPYNSFKTSSFLITKDLFHKIRFDETLTTYGHEDTLFGAELRKREAKIDHIDNPVVHIALDTNEAFLEKSKQALRNGLYLVNTGKLAADEIRALETFFRLKGSAGGRAILEFLIPSEHYLREKLLQPSPRLRSFDFLKLAWLRDIEKVAE